MKTKFNQVFEQLLPFCILGIAIALIIGLFIMLSYVLIWGILIGGMIWLGYVIKSFLFPSQLEEKNEGRIIDQNKDES